MRRRNSIIVMTSIVAGLLLAFVVARQAACTEPYDTTASDDLDAAPDDPSTPPPDLPDDWVTRFAVAATEEELLEVLDEYAATMSVEEATAVVEETGASDLALHTVLFRKAHVEASLGRFAAAAETYGRLAEMPTEAYPATASRYYQKLAEYEISPDQGLLAAGDQLPALVAELDRMLATAPDDGYQRDLRYRVAIGHQAIGDDAGFVEVAAPLLDGDDPEDAAFFERTPSLRASLRSLHVAALTELGRLEEAQASLRRLVAERRDDRDEPYVEAARAVFERRGSQPVEE